MLASVLTITPYYALIFNFGSMVQLLIYIIGILLTLQSREPILNLAFCVFYELVY